VPDRHKRKPISFRPPEEDHAWLLKHAEATGRPVRAVLADALAEYREHAEHVRTQIEVNKEGGQ
jgi:hypothetical protein